MIASLIIKQKDLTRGLDNGLYKGIKRHNNIGLMIHETENYKIIHSRLGMYPVKI